MEWTQEKIDEIYMAVQKKAVTDEEFREELLENPIAAIEKVAAVKLPEDFTIKVVENDPQYVATFVLPPMVSSELSREDMDAIAGGVLDNCGARVCAAEAKVSFKA